MVYASSTVTKRNNINQREKRKLKASLLGVANNNSERKKKLLSPRNHRNVCLQLLWVYFAALFSYGRYAYNSGRKNQLRATVARPSFSPSLSLCRFLIHASSMVLLFSLGLSFSFWGALPLCQQQKVRIISFYRKHQKVMVDGNGFFVAISLCEFTSKASHDIPFF